MTALERLFASTVAILEEEGVPAAAVGGLAVSVRTTPRFTRDVDLAVAVADDVHAERLSVFLGLAAPVARTGHLIALKVLARDDRKRPLDRVDLIGLIAVAAPAAVAAAREALRLIEARGFHRGRDLAAAFEAVLAEADFSG